MKTEITDTERLDWLDLGHFEYLGYVPKFSTNPEEKAYFYILKGEITFREKSFREAIDAAIKQERE